MVTKNEKIICDFISHFSSVVCSSINAYYRKCYSDPNNSSSIVSNSNVISVAGKYLGRKKTMILKKIDQQEVDVKYFHVPYTLECICPKCGKEEFLDFTDINSFRYPTLNKSFSLEVTCNSKCNHTWTVGYATLDIVMEIKPIELEYYI